MLDCLKLLKIFMDENNIDPVWLNYVNKKIIELNNTKTDKSNEDYDKSVIASIITDLFKLNAENLKGIAEICIKNNIQIGRRHKKILLRFLNYRRNTDLKLFFEELSIENQNISFDEVKKHIMSTPIIDCDFAYEKFLELWTLAMNENNIKKISEYLFGVYSRLYAYYNDAEFSNVDLFIYNKQFIRDDLSIDSINELEVFCNDKNKKISFYDKYIDLLKNELQKMSLKGMLESSMNQSVADLEMNNEDRICDRLGDTHYVLTESYDAIYFRLNQDVFDSFTNITSFYSYVLDTIKEAYRILVNNKVLAVEIDNIYVGKRNIKWLLYSYIGIYAENFIKTKENRKYYKPEIICKEMMAKFNITYDIKAEKDILAKLKRYYATKNQDDLLHCELDLYKNTNSKLSLEEFKQFLEEWSYVYYGFSFNDCLIVRGKIDTHEQYVENVENDNKLIYIFYKYRMDERKIPCPVCGGLNVVGNSYSEIGHRSWECKNIICKSRSKSNRGKRYSLKTNYMQNGIMKLNSENIIPKELIAKWRKDIAYVEKDSDIYEMFIKYFSFSGERVLFINGNSASISQKDSLGRKITNLTLLDEANFYKTELERYKWDNTIFDEYFCKGNYILRFIHYADNISLADEINIGMAEDKNAIIINGDSAKVLKRLQHRCVAASVTSPPYYNARAYSQWENIYLYLIDMKKVIKNTFNVLDDSGIFLYNIGDINGNEMTIAKSNMGTKRLLLGAYSILIFEKAGFELVDNYIWNKGEPQSKRSTNDGNFTPHYQKPVNCYEHMFIFKKAGKEISPNIENIPSNWKNFVVDFVPVYKINTKGENTLGHTAPFPEEIPNFVSKSFGKSNKFILDPFLGSGTTLIVSAKNELAGIGIEMLSEYSLLAKERIKDNANKKPKIYYEL